MAISEKVLEKYGVKQLEWYKNEFGKTSMTERMFYDTILKQTDHVPFKIFEDFIENMATASLAETFVVVLKFFRDVKITYAEVLAARKTAREEINRIESEIATE